jgi:hypothetical protein
MICGKSRGGRKKEINEGRNELEKKIIEKEERQVKM